MNKIYSVNLQLNCKVCSQEFEKVCKTKVAENASRSESGGSKLAEKRADKFVLCSLGTATFFHVFLQSLPYPHPKPFRDRFGAEIEAIVVPKLVQKSTKNRSKIDVCIRLRFLMDFPFKILFYIKAPN